MRRQELAIGDSEVMGRKTVSVLLICTMEQYYETERILATAFATVSFNLQWVASLPAGLQMLENNDIDVVLLALTLDEQGTNDLVWLRNQNPYIPVVVLTEVADTVAASNAVRNGAQDVLVRQELLSHSLVRSLLYAIERQRMIKELHTASMFDELTGLYNRRGFMDLARRFLKLADRSKQGMILFYADLDNLKVINDKYGHHAGDEAIVTVAQMLKGVFRASDIIARLGGDEFVVLALGADQTYAEKIIGRLREKEEAGKYPHVLLLSIGFAYCDPKNPSTIEELLANADRKMYEEKRLKQGKKHA